MQYQTSDLLNSIMGRMKQKIEGEGQEIEMTERLIGKPLCRKQRKEMAASLYFAHFKLGKGFATVATGKGTNETGEKQTAWGVAFCCPEDQWDRKEGRMRARENLFSDAGDENKVMFATSAEEEMFLAAPHDTCLLALQKELLVRRPHWYKKNRDKPETISRPRAKKKLGNLKPSVTINLAAVVSAVGGKGE